MVKDSKNLSDMLNAFTGLKTMLIRLKVKVFGDEAELLVYNTITLAKLVSKISEMTGLT